MDTKLGTPSETHEWIVHKGHAYLLPAHTRHWVVGPDEALSEEHLSLRARTEDGAVEVDLEPESP